jgi:hypothetical protein
LHPCGPWPVQLRFPTGYTGEDYVSCQGWREARLERCPRHPGGGCGFRRHGTYARKSPPDTRVARWYCRQAHQTFSLLPDCLAARLPGALVEVEQVVRRVEQACSLEAAADALRPDIELPGATRWTRRRVRAVHLGLTALRGLMPERFSSIPATVRAFAAAAGTEPVLPALRAMASAYLAHLPAPLGFHHRRVADGEPGVAAQQPMGPDPPPSCG